MPPPSTNVALLCLVGCWFAESSLVRNRGDPHPNSRLLTMVQWLVTFPLSTPPVRPLSLLVIVVKS